MLSFWFYTTTYDCIAIVSTQTKRNINFCFVTSVICHLYLLDRIVHSLAYEHQSIDDNWIACLC